MPTTLFQPRALTRDQIATKAALLANEFARLAQAFRGDADMPADPRGASLEAATGASLFHVEVSRAFPRREH